MEKYYYTNILMSFNSDQDHDFIYNTTTVLRQVNEMYKIKHVEIS